MASAVLQCVPTFDLWRLSRQAYGATQLAQDLEDIVGEWLHGLQRRHEGLGMENTVETNIRRLDPPGFSRDLVELAYPPLVQSHSGRSGCIGLPHMAWSGTDFRDHFLYEVQVGMVYNGVCAEIGRTFMLNPSLVSLKFPFAGLRYDKSYLGSSRVLCAAFKGSGETGPLYQRRTYRGLCL